MAVAETSERHTETELADAPENNLMQRLFCSPNRVFLISFVLLLLYNIEAIQDPPYWDEIVGRFNTAILLKQTGWDFRQLFVLEPGYYEGGSAIGKSFLLTYVEAVMYAVLPPAAIFVLLHVMTIALAALAFTLSFVLLEKRVGAGLAGLWSGAAAMLPMWNGQTAALGNDVPAAAAVMLGLYAFDRERYGWCCGWVLLAYLLKSTGIILALALVTWAVITAVAAWRTSRVERQFSGRDISLLVGPLLLIIGLRFGVDYGEGMEGGAQHLAQGLGRVMGYGKLCIPLLCLSVPVLILVSAGFFLRKGLWARILAHRLELMITILVLGFWASFVLYVHSLPRYASFAVFPTAMAMCLMLPRRVATGLGMVVLCWGAINQHGLLLPKLPSYVGRSGEYLERSREYLEDLASNRALCKYLEENHFERTIVTKYPHLHMLCLPELGYVSRALPNVVGTGLAPTTGAAKLLPKGQVIPAGALVLYAPSTFDLLCDVSLMPGPKDRLIEGDQSLATPVLIYERGQ